MARSIHATRAELERERAWRWADPALRRKRLRKVARALAAKRRIKEEVRRERANGAAAPVLPLDPDALAVRIVDHGRSIHYPASEADVRAILHALPPGTADGLTEIELLLGAFEQRESAREREFADIVRDPTGRLAIEHFPGVFGGICLGVYSPTRARIRLFAYVYDPELPDREAVEPYLKLRMLSTLVHEVAHHVHHRTRVARGRWRADDEEKDEAFAETREYAWIQEIVVPYVARAHPQALAALDRWFVEHAGTSAPLGLLAGDPRKHLFGDVASQFEELVRDLHSGKPPDAARVDFARELHYAEYYDLAHRVLDAVLAAEPWHLEALTLRADILVHERRLDEAEAVARELLARDEGCLDAWQVLTDLERERRAWPGVLAAASRGVELSAPGSLDRLSFVDDRSRALLELGEYEALEADLAILLGGAPSWRWRALGYRAIALLRAGRFAEALEVAVAGLLEAQGSFWRHELLAVRFDASRALHPSRPLLPLLPETLDDLRHRGYEDWADRLHDRT
jgi:tetratricopeptide (TPR) repeat protein